MRMTGAIAGAGGIALARVGASRIVTCGGRSSVGTQHCIPQPAAQGQPGSRPAGDGEPSTEVAAAHRLAVNGPAATDKGNSKACSAIT